MFFNSNCRFCRADGNDGRWNFIGWGIEIELTKKKRFISRVK